LDEDWETNTNFHAGEAVHGLSASSEAVAAKVDDLAISAEPPQPPASPATSVQPERYGSPPGEHLESSNPKASSLAGSDDIPDLTKGPGYLATRALKAAVIGLFVTPILLGFRAPFGLWLLTFLGFEAYAAWLLLQLGGLTVDLSSADSRKFMAAVVINAIAWCALVVFLAWFFRPVMIYR
jgi:hypothetical protein